MIDLVRYLFIVRYDYHDSEQQARARLLLPLVSVTALLGAAFGVSSVIIQATGEYSTHISALSGFMAPLIIVWTAIALWSVQHGNVGVAAAMIALLLGSMALISLAIDGLTASAVLTIPVVLTYMGLTYGARGAIPTVGLAWIALPAVAYLQSEGDLPAAAAPFDTLLSGALSSAGMLTLTALLLWIFSWNLQRAVARTSRIAAQTHATAAIGQALSRILNIEELLTNAADLIRDRFALYHVQIFMFDERRDYADLSASTGAIGTALLAQGYRVPADPRSVPGEVMISGEMLYIRDVTATAYRHPALLADTRTELALPLFAGDDVVGVLDIHSTRHAAFSSDDIEALRIVSNQAGQAIQNARLFEAQQRSLVQNRRLFLESETNLREIERLNRQLTGQSWQDYLLERGEERFSVRVDGDDIVSGSTHWTPAMRQAAERRRMISQEDNNEQIIAVPISIRGEPVGAVEVRLTGQQNQTEIRSILQTVTERMAFSLENARLFEQARMAAEREQQINLITAQLQGLTSVEDVLTMAISSLGQALGAEQGAIRLIGPEAAAPPDQGPPPGDRPAPPPAPGAPRDRGRVTGLFSLHDTNPGEDPDRQDQSS